MKYQDLIAEAMKAKEFAYAPYSHFRVGAALLTESGRIYTGCNVENASFSATNCAERTAVFTAVAQGEKEFRAIAVNGDTENYLPPCGVCRQVLAEFCDLETFQVILAQLLPGAFQSKDLVVNDTNKSTVVD